ncbi:MAG: hypothetical protein Ct9H90mP21_1030 [Methanobacteriota archaeon]|nr:MAG: hypothetical protein Ct9H90mP21_1030 [Euryarchaeota archaeon]
MDKPGSVFGVDVRANRLGDSPGQGNWNEFIFRSQFSNLLPILILALEIDDSLHSLHRYKEERRGGASSEQAVHKAIRRSDWLSCSLRHHDRGIHG